MNDFNLLLRSIITNPDEDSVRLAMADWYEEHGQLDRAEFIRVQCELAKANSVVVEMVNSLPNHHWEAEQYSNVKRLQQRERELWSSAYRDLFISDDFAPLSGLQFSFDTLRMTMANGLYTIQWSRGLILHITCSAEDFLKHADKLVWHPEMTDSCKNCHNGYVPTDREDNECENPVCDRGRVPRPCPDTAQPIRKVKLTTHSGFPIGENALQHTNVREFFESRPFPYSDYFRVRGWDQFRPMVPVQGKLDHYTCDVWPGIEFECLPPMVDVRLNSGGQGVDTLDAGPAPIRHNDPITSDIEGRAVPAGHSSSLDWVIGTATGPSRV